MCNKLKIKWLIGGVCGFFCLTALAETYPEPEKDKYAAPDLLKEKGLLTGKVIEVKFNRIAQIRRVKDGLYAGNLRSREMPEKSRDLKFFPDNPGLDVNFPAEGLGLFSKFIPILGAGINNTALGNDDSGAVYVLIGDQTSVALGDRYNGNGEYAWSKKAKIPDLTEANKISVTDVLLYPEQLTGQIIELQFYYVRELSKGVSTCTVSVRDGYGDSYSRLLIDFPPEGVEFFEEAEKQDAGVLVARKVFAAVELASPGSVSVKALGKRRQLKGDDAVYKW
ncbi:MAG: hypothetical protein MUC65_07775 [Pontiellaceae bacterium]|jgi:hypothetical protein|nr:hypothetical protein [Pontiellaceae bacterium]